MQPLPNYFGLLLATRRINSTKMSASRCRAFSSPQPDTYSLHSKIMDTCLVHGVVCLFISHPFGQASTKLFCFTTKAIRWHLNLPKVLGIGCTKLRCRRAISGRVYRDMTVFVVAAVCHLEGRFRVTYECSNSNSINKVVATRMNTADAGISIW